VAGTCREMVNSIRLSRNVVPAKKTSRARFQKQNNICFNICVDEWGSLFDTENIMTESAEFFEEKISSKVEQEVYRLEVATVKNNNS